MFNSCLLKKFKREYRWTNVNIGNFQKADCRYVYGQVKKKVKIRYKQKAGYIRYKHGSTDELLAC